MSHRLPPLSSLRAFEAVARLQSIKAAAGELNVTGGAVSLQIRNLEEWLGMPLFVRKARRLVLTNEGKRYFTSVSAAFRVLGEATRGLRGSGKSTLTVSCTQGFAMQWLVPRMDRFTAAAPHIDVKIDATHHLVDFERDDVDFAIRHGLGIYEGLASEKLVGDDLVPVASPALIGNATFASSNDLRQFTLLHDEHRDDWRAWIASAHADALDAERGVLFMGNAVVDAAKAGRGIALLRRSLIEEELRSGNLVQLFPQTLRVDIAYYLVYPQGVLDNGDAEIFRQWLHREARGM